MRLGAVTTVISPLLEIEFLPLDHSDPGEIPIFTSRNGVAGFLRGGGNAVGRCWCVGDATANSARQAGFSPQTASGDVDTLIQAILQSGGRGPFVHFRGEHVRGNLAERLREAGKVLREDVVYAQTLRPLNTAALDLLDGEIPVILPLFSPRTAMQFATDHRGGAPLLIGAMSQAIADALGGFAVQEVVIARRPNVPSMIDATQRLFDAAQRLEGGIGAK